MKNKTKIYNLLAKIGLNENTKIGESKRTIIPKTNIPNPKNSSYNSVKKNNRKGCSGCSRRKIRKNNENKYK